MRLYCDINKFVGQTFVNLVKSRKTRNINLTKFTLSTVHIQYIHTHIHVGTHTYMHIPPCNTEPTYVQGILHSGLYAALVGWSPWWWKKWLAYILSKLTDGIHRVTMERGIPEFPFSSKHHMYSAKYGGLSVYRNCLSTGTICLRGLSVYGDCLSTGTICLWGLSVYGDCLSTGIVCLQGLSVYGGCLSMGAVCLWGLSVYSDRLSMGTWLKI